ncbi:MAG: hypothetical protein ACE5JQ_15235 [Candidatus Methylomirabilales bacterium]
MEVKVQILAALIGAIGGLVGGGVTTVADYYFGLEAGRQERLQEARRNTYVQWLDVRQLHKQSGILRAAGKNDEADEVRAEFALKGRQIMGKIAVYGGQNVVESVARWYRTDVRLGACISSSLEEEEYLNEKQMFAAEIDVHQAMRGDLMPQEQLVSDADMSVLLFQCEMPTAR